jgi:hypothetical protein
MKWRLQCAGLVSQMRKEMHDKLIVAHVMNVYCADFLLTGIQTLRAGDTSA